MHETVIIQKLVKQNQKNIMKITKKAYKNKYKTVAEIFLMKKRTKKQNAEEMDVKICLKKIKKR